MEILKWKKAIPTPLLSSPGLTNGDAVVNMRKVTHQTISEELSKTILLPCLFTLRPSSSHEPPRIKWTKVWGQRGSDGLQKEQSVLVAKDNVVKVPYRLKGAAVRCLVSWFCKNTKRSVVFVYLSPITSTPTPSAGEEGLPGSCNAAWLQWEPLQR